MGAHFWPILALLVPIEDHLNVAACLGLTADLTVTIWLLLMHRVPKLRSPQLLSGTGQWVHCVKWRGLCCLQRGEHSRTESQSKMVYWIVVRDASNKRIKENKQPKLLQENQLHSMKMIRTKAILKVYKQHNRLQSFVRVLTKNKINLKTNDQLLTTYWPNVDFNSQPVV